MRSNETAELGSVLFSEDAIRRRVRELGAEITRDYEGRDPVLISVLQGGAWFLADTLSGPGQVVLADTARNLLDNPLMREAYLDEI